LRISKRRRRTSSNIKTHHPAPIGNKAVRLNQLKTLNGPFKKPEVSSIWARQSWAEKDHKEQSGKQ
jgi:hypothetical protein